MNRFDLSVNCLKWIEDIIDLHNPDIVVNLGDTFDGHSVLRSELLCEFRNHIQRINKPHYYILGNHDFFRPKDSKYHALQVFKDYPEFYVIDERCDIDNMTMVPYIADLNNFPLDTKEICIAHQTFIGADYGYHRPDAGVNADNVSADIIISGHVHKKQEFGKVIYPGTPYACGANDLDMTKGLLIFDTKSYEQTFIESPFPKWKSIEFIISNEQTMSDLHSILKETINEQDHWIIKVAGPKVEMSAYFKSAQYKKISKGKHITLKLTATDKEKKQVRIKAVSTPDIIKEYIDKVYKGTIDKKQLESKALEIITGQNK